jgi:hypothetical protein
MTAEQFDDDDEDIDASRHNDRSFHQQFILRKNFPEDSDRDEESNLIKNRLSTFHEITHFIVVQINAIILKLVD